MTPEEQNRDRKCRRIVAFMISELHRLAAANPEQYLPDAARGAGYNSISEPSQRRVVQMLDELAGRLARDKNGPVQTLDSGAVSPESDAEQAIRQRGI